jgi:MFS family permease
MTTPLLWIFVARIVDGLSGGNLTIAQAYIADISLPEDRARSHGIIGVAFGLGFLIGPALGGFLSRWGYDASLRGRSNLRQYHGDALPSARNATPA